MYNDEDKDHYFINIEDDIDIFNENIQDFINKTIKKNVIYKLIKDIFKESDNSWIKRMSKDVKDTDDEQSFFKKLRTTITNKKFRVLFDKILKDYFMKKIEKEEKQKDKKHDLDDKTEPEPKKCKYQTIKKEKDYKKELISNIRPMIYRGGIENIVIPLTISSLLDLYIKVVDTNQEELKKIETIILTHLNNYPDATWFTFYKPTDKTNDFFKKAKYLTKQHYLDIVYRILVLRDLDLELDDLIKNIFDGLEI